MVLRENQEMLVIEVSFLVLLDRMLSKTVILVKKVEIQTLVLNIDLVSKCNSSSVAKKLS